MLDSILGYLKNIKVDEGLQARSLNPPIQKTRNQRQVIRRKSPLQYACSLGLYQIVDRLLQEGANPDGLNGVQPNKIQNPNQNPDSLPTFEQSMNTDIYPTQYNYQDGQTPLLIILQEKLHNQDLNVDGLSYKRNFKAGRDVDYHACLRLLLKFNADTNLSSSGGKIPIFKALKARVPTLQLFLEYDDQRIQTVNSINKKKLTPLCKLASQPESEENIQKITLLLQHQASCKPSLPEFHPLYCALDSKNYQALRAIFKNSDAIDSLPDYSNLRLSPFLLEIVKSNNNFLIEDCFKDWFKYTKE